MSKRSAQNRKKLFNLDLESLLINDLSQEERNEVPSSESLNQPKKFKSKEKPLNGNKLDEDDLKNDIKIDDIELDDVNDVSKFFENVGNDFSKSMQVRKMRLNQFTESVIGLYQSKISEMIKKQENEVENFKKKAAGNIEDEINKFEEEFKKVKQQESKLMKILEQQLKMLQKSSTIQEQWIENFTKLHQNFLQGYKELKDKHKNETLDLKQTLNDEILNIQNKFVMDAKKEEMQTMKKYLSSVYF